MRRPFVIIFLVIVLVPLGMVAFLGLKIARDERQLSQHQFQKLLEGRLADVKTGVDQSVEALERSLLRALPEGDLGPEQLRALVRTEPLVRQGFALGADGKLTFPTKGGDASVEELEFLERTAPIWNQRAVLYVPPGGERPVAGSRERRGDGDSLLDLAAAHEYGWVTWYWEEGLHLLFWRRQGDGAVGVEVERIALLSRVVGKLPTAGLEAGRMVLSDSKSDPVHQWGPHEPNAQDRPAATLPLSYPLNAWRLHYYVSDDQQASIYGGGIPTSAVLGVVAVAIALLGMAVYFYREYSRRMRDAAQRVTFVTQVSHELKTPLTNIRMYAELMDNDVDEEDEKTVHRLSIIVSESQRLTRLINNILTFSRHRRGALQVKRSSIDIDEVVQKTLAQFAPALESKGVEYDLTLGAERRVLADPDAVEQIVANLVSNVEKYAAAGGVLEVETIERENDTLVTVRDRGPGVPKEHHEKVFTPFYRVSDKLADGVTGTGIGLAIARQLARLNGGDLEIVDVDVGACFKLTLSNEGKADESTRS